MALLATPTLGAAVGNNLAARSAELDARAAEALEVRAAALVCQFGGVKACSAEDMRLQLGQLDVQHPHAELMIIDNIIIQARAKAIFTHTHSIICSSVKMIVTKLIVLAASITSVLAAPPFRFPTPDGFPNVTAAQLAQIQRGAGGSLASSFLPTSLKDGAITALQLLANNEIFEVAFFTELLNNITTNVPGYDAAATAPLNRTDLINAIQAIVNQEELHALGANGILQGADQAPIAPCQYDFPVCNFRQAILLAQTFTDIALGAVPVVQTLFANDGGEEIRNVPLLGSILGQEAQQDGFFRYVQHKTPSAAPFLTGGSLDFAFTALHAFIVPDSCPTPLSSISLTNFKPLEVYRGPAGVPGPRKTVLFRLPANETIDCERQSIAYISGQNVPFQVPFEDCQPYPPSSDNRTYAFASFPIDSGKITNGLTIAAIVNVPANGTNTLLTPDAVAAATVFGPGLIEYN
ncbi:MAG: hypothetical protein Q9219_004091 [cf. Caloplaca sp. 3 TL-2023]